MIEQNINSLVTTKNQHYIDRYLRFIYSRKEQEENFHRHHILPKAKDMFPQFKNSQEFPWNCIKLSYREHFIAHWILAKAFPKSSQQRAFYHMVNLLNRKRSKDYEYAKKKHIELIIAITQNAGRNEKISKSLKGKPKSEEHKKKLSLHRHSEETKKKIRDANIGKKMSDEQRKKLSVQRTGKSKAKNTIQSKLNIAESKCNKKLITPLGIFFSQLEASIAFNVTPRRMVLIFRNLDIIPRKKVISELGLSYDKNKTYRDYGFSTEDK